MTTLEKLRAKLRETIGKMEALNASALSEDGELRELTAEEQEDFKALEKLAETTRVAIERQEKIQEAQQANARLSAPAGRIPDVTITRSENCNERGEYRGFRSLGEQLVCVAAACNPNGAVVDRRLTELATISGMGELVGTDGGFLVQSDFMLDLQKQTYDEGKLARLCRRITLGPNSNALDMVTVDETSRADGSRWGGVRAYWKAEAATVTASHPKFRKLHVPLESMMALCYATSELLQDAVGLGSVISIAFPQEMAFVLDDAILNGDGAGKPIGIRSGAAIIEVAKETNQTADTIVFANVSNMRYRVVPRSLYRFVWLVNQEGLPQLERMYLSTGSAHGVPVYQPAGVNGAEQDTLYKRPIITCEQSPKLGDSGDIIAADLGEYLLIEKGTIDATSSIHVRYLYDETAFRFVMRCNGLPVYNSAVTPYSGTSGVTYSPYVTLAERA